MQDRVAQGIEFDYNQCWKSVKHFLSTDYINICTGERSNVPVGEWDLFAFPLFLVLMAIIAWATYRIINSQS
jgi:hypothetical protein